MPVDTYTKAVLTIIAACLVYMSMGGPALVPAAQAQPEPQRVIIAGWTSSGNPGTNNVTGKLNSDVMRVDQGIPVRVTNPTR